MSNHKIELSIIIVAYRAEKELDQLINSIPKKKSWEVIVVDNNKINRGFGKGCNLGAKKAKGEFLLFINPDCVVKDRAIDKLLKKLRSDKSIGIIGPQLVNEKNQAYLSYSRQPNRFSAFVVYSFLNRILWNSQVVQRHWMQDSNLDEPKSVGIISGAVMMIRKSDFVKVGGFDERFFMYWEEVDLCRRLINDLGKQVFYYPQARVVHLGEKSTQVGSLKTRHWFYQSRFKFFAKHYGWWYAELLDTWLRLTEEWRLLVIVIVASYTRFIYLPAVSWVSIGLGSWIGFYIWPAAWILLVALTYRGMEIITQRRTAFILGLVLAVAGYWL